MTTGYVLQSLKPDGPVFEIVAYDTDTKIGKLKGVMGVEFRESLDKERLKKYGYKIVPAEQARVQTAPPPEIVVEEVTTETEVYEPEAPHAVE